MNYRGAMSAGYTRLTSNRIVCFVNPAGSERPGLLEREPSSVHGRGNRMAQHAKLILWEYCAENQEISTAARGHPRIRSSRAKHATKPRNIVSARHDI